VGKTAGFSWTDEKRNTVTAKLKVTQVLDKIQDLRKKFETAYKQNTS
jgi:hypothetical protein